MHRYPTCPQPWSPDMTPAAVSPRRPAPSRMSLAFDPLIGYQNRPVRADQDRIPLVRTGHRLRPRPRRCDGSSSTKSNFRPYFFVPEPCRRSTDVPTTTSSLNSGGSCRNPTAPVVQPGATPAGRSKVLPVPTPTGTWRRLAPSARALGKIGAFSPHPEHPDPPLVIIPRDQQIHRPIPYLFMSPQEPRRCFMCAGRSPPGRPPVRSPYDHGEIHDEPEENAGPSAIKSHPARHLLGHPQLKIGPLMAVTIAWAPWLPSLCHPPNHCQRRARWTAPSWSTNPSGRRTKPGANRPIRFLPASA